MRRLGGRNPHNSSRLTDRRCLLLLHPLPSLVTCDLIQQPRRVCRGLQLLSPRLTGHYLVRARRNPVLLSDAEVIQRLWALWSKVPRPLPALSPDLFLREVGELLLLVLRILRCHLVPPSEPVATDVIAPYARGVRGGPLRPHDCWIEWRDTGRRRAGRRRRHRRCRRRRRRRGHHCRPRHGVPKRLSGPVGIHSGD